MRRLMILSAVASLLVAPIHPAAAAPSNDAFAAAALLSGSSGEVPFDTTGATVEAGEPDHWDGWGGPTIWYRFRAPASGVLVLEVKDTPFDAVVAAYKGETLGGLVAIPFDPHGGHGGPPGSSRIFFPVGALQEIRVVVGGLTDSEGPGRLVWRFNPYAADRREGRVEQIPAGTTIETGVRLSRLAFPDGGARSVLVARADLFADTLAGGGLAGDRPLLFTRRDGLSDEVAAELRRLGATSAVVLGGTGAVDDRVLAELEQMGVSAERAAGRTRIDTAIAVAQRVLSGTAASTALLARAAGTAGDDTRAFADSIAAGGWAAAERWPVLLSESERLSAATADHIRAAGYRRVIVIGGPGALSDRVVADLAGLGVTVERIAGPTRHHTAAAIAAARGLTDLNRLSHVIVVDGVSADAWAAGLAAATFSAQRSAPVLLAGGDALPSATVSALTPGSPFGRGGEAAAVCAAAPGACGEVALLLAPPGGGVSCQEEFAIAGHRGCQADIAGMAVRFFPLPEGTPVRRLALYFHGDDGKGWIEGWGFHPDILDWAKPRGILVAGLLSPGLHPTHGFPAYGSAGPHHARIVAGALEHFADRFSVAERRSLFWGTSGGAVFLSSYLVPIAGSRLPGVAALSCGGGFHDTTSGMWSWDPGDKATRDLFALLYNYGDRDFLADGNREGRDGYRRLGFAVEEIVHAGAEHCDHPINDPTLRFWERHVG